MVNRTIIILLSMILMGLTLAVPAFGYENLSAPTYTEVDALSRLTISADPYEQWTYTGNWEDTTACLYRDFGANYFDLAWQVTFLVEGFNLGGSGWRRTVCAGFANVGQAIPTTLGEGGNAVLIYWLEDTTGNYKIQLWLYENGAFVDGFSSVGTFTYTHTIAVTLTRYQDTYTISALDTDNGNLELFSDDTTAVATTPNLKYQYFLPFSYFDAATNASTIWAKNYTITQQDDPEPPYNGPEFYVGPSATGTEDGSDRDNLMTLAQFDATAEPGDTAWIQPGSYPAYELTGVYGTAVGGVISYRADPVTCGARASDWYDTTTVLEPNPVTDPVFAKLTIATYGSGTPTGHYLYMEGLSVLSSSVGQYIYCLQLRELVGQLTVKNCNFVGMDPGDIYYSNYMMANKAISENAPGSVHTDILYDSCYISRVNIAWYPSGTFTNVVMRNCHIHHIAAMMLWLYAPCTIDGCNLHDQTIMADEATSYSGDLAIASVGSPDTTVFVYSGDDPTGYSQWVHIVGGGEDEWRPCGHSIYGGSYNTSTNTVTLGAPCSFSIIPGTHTAHFYNQVHGCPVSIHASNITVRNCYVHYRGATGGIYNYEDDAHDLTIENNVVYGISSSTAAIHTNDHPTGNNIVVRQNTVMGVQAAAYPGIAYHRYGPAIWLTANGVADLSTYLVTNNIFAGVSTVPSGAIVQNNIVFWGSTFQEDSEGDNKNNLVYFEAADIGPFDTDFFVGNETLPEGASTWAEVYETYSPLNWNDAFDLLAASDAVGFGSTTVGHYTATDIHGHPRDAAPDAGADEYGAGVHCFIFAH